MEKQKSYKITLFSSSVSKAAWSVVWERQEGEVKRGNKQGQGAERVVKSVIDLWHSKRHGSCSNNGLCGEYRCSLHEGNMCCYVCDFDCMYVFFSVSVCVSECVVCILCTH